MNHAQIRAWVNHMGLGDLPVVNLPTLKKGAVDPLPGSGKAQPIFKLHLWLETGANLRLHLSDYATTLPNGTVVPRKFGAGTDASVREFQRLSNMPVTGVVDEKTWSALILSAPAARTSSEEREWARAILSGASTSEPVVVSPPSNSVAPLPVAPPSIINAVPKTPPADSAITNEVRISEDARLALSNRTALRLGAPSTWPQWARYAVPAVGVLAVVLLVRR